MNVRPTSDGGVARILPPLRRQAPRPLFARRAWPGRSRLTAAKPLFVQCNAPLARKTGFGVGDAKELFNGGAGRNLLKILIAESAQETEIDTTGESNRVTWHMGMHAAGGVCAPTSMERDYILS